jgi:hypothetical protein
VNGFRLLATESAQVPVQPGPITSAAAAGATTFIIGGLLTGQAVLAGQMITVNDQLLILKSDSTPSTATSVVVTFEPPLRAAVAASTTVEVRRPWGLMFSPESRLGWRVSRGQVYDAPSISLEEDF